jgi:hypothetical protein
MWSLRPGRTNCAIIAALLLVPIPTVAGPVPSEAGRLLELARAADRVFDEQPAWQEEVGRLPELPLLVEHVAAYIQEEGYGSGHIPAEVTMDASFGASRSLVSGRYDANADRVELSERFRADPTWANQPWLGVLIHEMLHAEGYPIEAHVQVITFEILATMANDGYPGALVELADRLRRHALLSAWWLAAYEHESLPSRLSDRNLPPFCEMGCTQVSGDVGEVEVVRRSVFDAAELRRFLARERFWLERSQRDYDKMLGSYVAEPLGVVIAAACGEGLPITLVREVEWPPLFPGVADTHAFLAEIGWC